MTPEDGLDERFDVVVESRERFEVSARPGVSEVVEDMPNCLGTDDRSRQLRTGLVSNYSFSHVIFFPSLLCCAACSGGGMGPLEGAGEGCGAPREPPSIR